MPRIVLVGLWVAKLSYFGGITRKGLDPTWKSNKDINLHFEIQKPKIIFVTKPALILILSGLVRHFQLSNLICQSSILKAWKVYWYIHKLFMSCLHLNVRRLLICSEWAKICHTSYFFYHILCLMPSTCCVSNYLNSRTMVIYMVQLSIPYLNNLINDRHNFTLFFIYFLKT